MKKAIYIMVAALGLWSCNRHSSKNEGKSTIEPLQTELAMAMTPMENKGL